MEVLLEYRGSRRTLSVASSEAVVDVVARELRRIGRRQATVVLGEADLSQDMADAKIFILQKWSAQWECFVDVRESGEVADGDRLGVVAKPKPPSRFMRLFCCGCAARADENKHRMAVGNMLSGVKKNEEIQSLDYMFNVESELSSHASEWESQSLKPYENEEVDGVADEYVRADSGRASWKLVPTKPLVHSQINTGAVDSSSSACSTGGQENNEEEEEEEEEEGNLQESSKQPSGSEGGSKETSPDSEASGEATDKTKGGEERQASEPGDGTSLEKEDTSEATEKEAEAIGEESGGAADHETQEENTD